MRKFRRCPNCGHEVSGNKCNWCHAVLTPDRPVTREEAKENKLQVAEPTEKAATETADKARPEALAESSAKSSTMIIIDAQQRARQIINAAEQTARGLSAKAKADADTKSIMIVADAQQKAAQVLREAEQAASALADRARAEAETKSTITLNNARREAARLLREAEQAAAELTDPVQLYGAHSLGNGFFLPVV